MNIHFYSFRNVKKALLCKSVFFPERHKSIDFKSDFNHHFWEWQDEESPKIELGIALTKLSHLQSSFNITKEGLQQIQTLWLYWIKPILCAQICKLMLRLLRKICGCERISEEDEKRREAPGPVCRNPSHPVTERIYSLVTPIFTEDGWLSFTLSAFHCGEKEPAGS